MNIINKLTLRHLKGNKRRTLVTIMGVIISVAMLTAVATLAVSFIDLGQKQHIKSEGEWHAFYGDVDETQLAAIRADKNTKDVILSEDLGYAVLEESQNTQKPYIFLKEFNKEGFEKFPISLTEGEIPTKENELLISDHILSNGKVEFKIGDKVTLNVGERVTSDGDLQDFILDQGFSLQSMDGEVIESIENTINKDYTIVGIMKRPSWERVYSPGFTALSYIDEADLLPNETVDASVIWNKVNRTVKTEAETLSGTLKVEDFSVNGDLLRYYGVINNDGLRSTMYSLAAIIMSVIIIGSVSLIYNSFAISVSERSRHLGMLSSIGATKKQKRNSVFFEGFIIGLIGIPLGIIAGILGIAITFYYINPLIQDAMQMEAKLSVVITPLSLIVASAVSILTIFISTYIPAKKASNISAIDAIRQTADIKLSRRKVKTSKIVRKIFGIEAEFGLKNLKRNKRRYQAVVLSLVVSIVLFLTVSFFTNQLRQSTEALQDGVNYDIVIHSYNFNNYAEVFNDDFINNITSLEEIGKHSLIYTPQIMIGKFKKQQLPESLYDKLGSDDLNVHLQVLDEKSIKTYAKENGVSYASLTNPEKITGIIINQVKGIEGKYGLIKPVEMAAGESFELISFNNESEEIQPVKDLEVIALSDNFPLGVSPMELGDLNVVVSEQSFKQINSDELLENGVTASLYLNSSNPVGVHDNLEDLIDNGMYIQNLEANRQDAEQIILLLSVFIYGFIALISAISIANIFNTISTSVSLRKREFAMLKSVGMTPKGFNRMINYESIFYGIKSLAYGLPISGLVMFLIYRTMSESFEYGFKVPWLSVLVVIVSVFLIVGSAMLYSSSKVRKETIIDGLKQENS